jgi:hypothetical protein
MKKIVNKINMFRAAILEDKLTLTEMVMVFIVIVIVVGTGILAFNPNAWKAFN